jgi:hypothetical protein
LGGSRAELTAPSRPGSLGPRFFSPLVRLPVVFSLEFSPGGDIKSFFVVGFVKNSSSANSFAQAQLADLMFLFDPERPCFPYICARSKLSPRFITQAQSSASMFSRI